MNQTVRESTELREDARRIPFDPALWQWRPGNNGGFEHVATGQVRADHEFDWESPATVPVIFAPDDWRPPAPTPRGAS